MTIPAPKKERSTRRTIRMSDELVRMIDNYNNGLFTARSEFVIGAVREYANHLIGFYSNCIKDYKDVGSVEDMVSAVELEVSHKVAEIFKNMPATPENLSECTTVMVYLPSGLGSQIDYIIDLIPELKNTTVFTRAAVYYKIAKNFVESENVKLIEDFKEQKKSMNTGVYVKAMERNYEHLRNLGVEYIDDNTLRYSENSD